MFTLPTVLTEPWCWYCGTTEADAWHKEHVLPRFRGGSDHPTNLVLACAPCNFAKGTMTLEEFRVHLWNTSHDGGPMPIFAGEQLPTGVIPEEPLETVALKLPERLTALVRVAAGSRGLTVDDWAFGVFGQEIERLLKVGSR